MRSRLLAAAVGLFLVLLPTAVSAELPWQFEPHTRYMALGDSLAAGYGAVPATQGYVYLLYHSGAFDTVPHTLFSNAGVPGATSRQVLDHQVPLAIEAFQPDVITITVGGNDLLRILSGANPADVLAEFQANLTQILLRLRAGLPEARIYVSNLYTIPEIRGADQIVPLFNQVVVGVAAAFDVRVADFYGAFLGRSGLLLVERHGAGQYEVHPTNAGYRAMADAFVAAIE
jgi:lysophospholipase L1-like esterase